jgi:anti-sigma factor RsiW
MNCSQIDLKAYLLSELSNSERLAVEEHLSHCEVCQTELERLRAVGAALSALVEEEIPRRIAFVSDPVFGPSFWTRLWNSAPRLVFASSVVLAIAIVIHAFVRPAPVILSARGVDAAALEARVEAALAAKLKTTAEETAAQAAAKQFQKTVQLVAAAEKRLEKKRTAELVAVEERLDYLRKKIGVMTLASNQSGGVR